MLKERDDIIRRAMILFDALIVSFAFFLAHFLRQDFHTFYRLDLAPSTQVINDSVVSINNYILEFFFIVPCWCLMLYLNGMYRSMRSRSLPQIIWIIIKSSLFVTLAFGALVFLLKIMFVSRLFYAIFLFLSTSFILAEKTFVFIFKNNIRKRGYNYRTILIVGTGCRAVELVDKINGHPEWGMRVIGAVNDDYGQNIDKVGSVQVIGNLDDLSEMLHRFAVDEVIFVVSRSRLDNIQEAILACETEGIKATIAVDFFDLKIAKASVTELDGIPLVRFATTNVTEWQLFIKRGIDVCVAGLGLVLLIPLFFFVVIFIKLTSSGPVLFRQERLGLNGKKFILYKFRTMYEGAQEALLNRNDVHEMNGPDFRNEKLRWITPVGKILRKFSIDELPQLLNVFLGHMSLIGPRPTVPDEASQYKSWQRRRFSMKPGITCLWQINGRNKLTHDEWMKMDLDYLDNWSLWLDLKILVKTIPSVLLGTGAY